MEEEEDEYGRDVRENNAKIVHCLMELKKQRDDLMFLVQKQKDEKKKLEMEMERLTYKLCLINKSMAQRLKAKQNYDSTIEEIEERYRQLRQNSGDLMLMVGKDCDHLDSILNKKTNTENVLSEAGTDISSKISSEEECICLPNKDGKCVREKTVSRMVQAGPETEVPTKLEKGSDELEKRDTVASRTNLERAAQTSITGEPEVHTEETDSAIEDQKSKLSRAASEYKEASLRTSQ